MRQRKLTEDTVHRVIEMAWEDRTPIDAIKKQFSLSEKQIIVLMRTHLRSASFRNWRKRVAGRKTKHMALRSKAISRSHCSLQYKQKSR
ncbi:TIGR03643 family protein [Betaproteobacteria bacterium]|nr:TIGR03643 family protein [Betaproteobacteria bacterium]